MKLAISLVIAAWISCSLSAQVATDLSAGIANTRLESGEDSLAYALAVLSFNSLARENIHPDPLIFAKALIDGGNGKSLMSEEVAKGIVMLFVNERQARQAELDKATYKDYIEENEAFLAKNRLKPGVSVTPSGLQYEVVTMGTGDKPTRINTVKVHYTGTLIDGTEFDSSVKRNIPAQFPVSGVIPGWTEALQLMPVGSKFILYIPESLGYGSRAAGDKIKPYSALIFEVELLEIVK
ncbi:MAG: FKBP-type peptidyl-prolyl cis-trans isomerase [Bacteroidales bacterium]